MTPELCSLIFVSHDPLTLLLIGLVFSGFLNVFPPIWSSFPWTGGRWRKVGLLPMIGGAFGVIGVSLLFFSFASAAVRCGAICCR
jgi:hypothetical protein